MKSVNVAFGVFIDDAVGDDDGTSLVSCPDTVEGETTRKTSDRAEETFESLREMVGNVVFVYLNHRPPGAFLVIDLRLTTDTDDARVVCSACNQAIERVRCDGLRGW